MGKHSKKVACEHCDAYHGPSKSARRKHYRDAKHPDRKTGRPKTLTEPEVADHLKQNWRNWYAKQVAPGATPTPGFKRKIAKDKEKRAEARRVKEACKAGNKKLMEEVDYELTKRSTPNSQAVSACAREPEDEGEAGAQSPKK